MFLVFQAVFAWASYPMDWIEMGFGWAAETLRSNLPAGWFTDLLTEGVISGLGGIVVFVPQIAILFFFIGVLEETGYMTRVVFIMDRLVRPFGLNGRSVVPLVSSAACAIPAILSTRVIGNPKERLITIFVAPFMSCSARIPVYTLLISVVIPKTYIGGILSLQGLVLFGLYLLGILFALGTALVLQFLVKNRTSGYHVMELPDYKNPRMSNVGYTVFEKVKVLISPHLIFTRFLFDPVISKSDLPWVTSQLICLHYYY